MIINYLALSEHKLIGVCLILWAKITNVIARFFIFEALYLLSGKTQNVTAWRFHDTTSVPSRVGQ